MNALLTKYITIVGLLFLSVNNNLIAQNLVKNPSFEDYLSCPTTGLMDGYLIGWDVLYQNSAEYFHSCSNNIPLNSYGYQPARTGNAYTVITAYYYDFYYTAIGEEDARSYIENKLMNPLQKDSIYCVSYYLSLQDSGDYGISGPNGAIQNVDAYLSDTIVDWNNGFARRISGITPQIKSQQLLEDTENWMLVSDLYKAKGGEQYIIIGNFLKPQNTVKVYYKPDMQVNYYIDDVSVTPFTIAPPKLGNDTIICNNTPFNLAAPIGYDEYLWSNGANTTTLAIADSGTYWVKCIANGCGEITDTIHIGYYNTPTLNLGNDTTICKGNTVQLAAQQGFNNYLWSTGDTVNQITINQQGVYTLEVISNCGRQYDSIAVFVDSLPSFSFAIGNDTNICNEGTTIPLTLFADTILPNYLWSTGETTNSITINSEGTYWLSTHFLCGDIYSNSITVTQCPPDSIFNVFIPNAFTPDNDGINDVFMPVLYQSIGVDFKVFNLWGNLIYQSNTDFFWDGSFQNNPCSSGIYIYQLMIKDENNISQQYLGKFSLLR
jgi:gliding motility-associated-like protein